MTPVEAALPVVAPATPEGENKQLPSEACISPETLRLLSIVLLLLSTDEAVVWVVAALEDWLAMAEITAAAVTLAPLLI